MRFKSRTRALGVAALAATVGLAGLATAPLAGALHQQDRVAGANRFDTAAEISKVLTAGGASGPFAGIVQTEVVLVNGLNFPDALAAAALAGKKDARILLTTTDTLPTDTQNELNSLGAATNITIVGGPAAVSEAQATALDAAYGTVTRVQGDNRFSTAASVATTLGAAPAVDNGAGALPTAFLADGFNYADALSAGAASHKLEIPIVLHDKGDDVQANTGAAIQALGVKQVIILGGTAAVPASVDADLANFGVTQVARLAGATRYETASMVGQFHLDKAGFAKTWAFLAAGDSFADALAGAPLAAAFNGPLVLAQKCAMPQATTDFFTTNKFSNIELLGGTGALCDDVNTAAQALVAAAPAGVTSRPELVSASIISTTTTTAASTANPAGTVVEYVFDESLTAVTQTGFAVYTAAGTRTPSAATNVAITAGNNAVVRVLYPAINTAALAGQLTTAVVELGGATDASGQQSPEGAEAIGAGSTGSLAAGTTDAPDLLSLGGFRATTTAGTVAVDFTFDENAFVQATTGLQLVSTDGRFIGCTGPATTTSNNTLPSGQNVAGGNGSTVITATCGQFPAAGALVATTASSANTARGVALLSAVGDTPPAAVTVNGVTGAACAPGTNNCNPLQATSTPDAASGTPDLVSATFTPGTPGVTNDQVTYVFDQNVQSTVTDAEFHIYSSTGAQTAATTTAPSQVNGTQVAVFFPAGTLASAVGASVDPSAVTAVAGANPANLSDEVGVANSGATTITPGKTAAPDLTGVSLSQATVGFATTTTATFTFDEALGAAVTDAGAAPLMFLHLPDGARMVCSGTTAGGTFVKGTGLNGLTTSQASCSAWTFVDGAPDQSGTNTGAATAAQVFSTVLATVNQAAVPAAGDLADTAGTFTPEGDVATSKA